MSLLCSTSSTAFPSHLEYKSNPLHCPKRPHTIGLNHLSDTISFHCPLTHFTLVHWPSCCSKYMPLPLQVFALVGSLLGKHFLQIHTELAFSVLSSLFISKAILNINHSNYPPYLFSRAPTVPPPLLPFSPWHLSTSDILWLCLFIY